MLSSVVRRMIAMALVTYAVARRIVTNPTVIYIFRRILATIPVMAVVALFVFSLLYIAPGDPAAIIAGDQATPDDVIRIRASLGLDRPFLVRFSEWVWQLLHGDLGTSIFTNLPVTTLIHQRIEPIIVIGFTACGRTRGANGITAILVAEKLYRDYPLATIAEFAEYVPDIAIHTLEAVYPYKLPNRVMIALNVARGAQAAAAFLTGRDLLNVCRRA